MTLAPILYSAQVAGNHGIPETIAADYAYSLNQAFRQIYRESGIKPAVKRDNGGARTKAQCNALGTPWYVSDHYEDAGDSAAADIDNQRAIRNAIGSARFEAIMAFWGWHNVTVNGLKFTREPWHFANQDPSPIQAPAGIPATVTRAKEPNMVLLINSESSRKNPLAKYPGAILIVSDTKLQTVVGTGVSLERTYMPTATVTGDVAVLNQLHRFGWSAADLDALRRVNRNDAYIIRNGATKSQVLWP